MYHDRQIMPSCVTQNHLENSSASLHTPFDMYNLLDILCISQNRTKASITRNKMGLDGGIRKAPCSMASNTLLERAVLPLFKKNQSREYAYF